VESEPRLRHFPKLRPSSIFLIMIACQKHLFNIAERITYLNCSYMSPQLLKVSEAGFRGMLQKETPWELTVQDFFENSEKARQLFARLIDAEADDIAIISAASYGISTAAKNLKPESDEKIILLQDQFPSNVYPWQALAREKNAGIDMVTRPADGDWTAALLSRINASTAIVALPHCHWTDGSLVDLTKIREECDKVEAALVIDATQSLGAIPFSVKKIRPDYLISACYKWLLGPYSLGFMYVHPSRQNGEPLEHNWIHRKNSEDFAGLVSYREDFQPGARRFDVGERSNFALLPMAIAALEQILEWGVSEIAKTLSVFTDQIAQQANALQLHVLPPHLRAGHMIGLRFSNGVPPDLIKRLSDQQIYVSVRADSIRVAPHLYNRVQDIERFFAAMNGSL
jgi:selenocysteine lyase/cysteine desulfurase